MLIQLSHSFASLLFSSSLQYYRSSSSYLSCLWFLLSHYQFTVSYIASSYISLYNHCSLASFFPVILSHSLIIPIYSYSFLINKCHILILFLLICLFVFLLLNSLLIFETARSHLLATQDSEVVGGFISPVHDHYRMYKKTLIDSQHRIGMCEVATQSHPWISVQPYETHRAQWVTTESVLRAYRDEILNRIEKLAKLNISPNNCMEKANDQYSKADQHPLRNIKVSLLCGADLIESTLIPGLWSESDLHSIFSNFGVVVLERQGLDLAGLVKKTPFLAQYSHNIKIVPQDVVNTISSTALRSRLQEGKSIRYLTPDPVIEYIYKHKLFGHQKNFETPALTLGLDNNKPIDPFLSSADSPYLP
jgi:nicotinamide mononucleotide adenylyltransferase